MINRFGNLSDTLGLSDFIEGPWDFTVQDKGYFVKVFISNLLTGTFIGELAIDAMPGGAFGLSLVQFNDDQVRFAAVDDNAHALKLMTVNVPDSPPSF